MSEDNYRLKNGFRFIVAIDYVEPDYSPNMQGFDSHMQLFHTTSLNRARKRLKTEYEKTVAYAKEIGIDTDNEDCFDAWLHPNNESYEIYAGDTFSETGKIYESERA